MAESEEELKSLLMKVKEESEKVGLKWFEELTHLKRPWCWERLKAGGEWANRGWDGINRGWMASLTQWTWVWVSSGSWWWTGKPGVLQSMEPQRVRYDWVTELNIDEPKIMLNERSQSQKSTNYMIQFILNVQNKHIYRKKD